MSNQMSRRQFLQIASTSAVGLFAAACVAPTASTGGATTNGSAESKKLIFSSYTWSNSEGVMNKILDDWKAKNPGVELETQYAADDYWTKIQTQMASGIVPDTGISDTGRVISYAKTGTLLALDDFIARDGVDLKQYFPAAVAQYRWRDGDFDTGAEDGKMYGLPSDGQGFIFVYNKTLFDAAKVDYPTADWTWDDLVTAAQKLTNADEDKWGVISPVLYALERGNFVYAAGGEFITPDYKHMTLDKEETVSAYKWAWDLIYTQKVSAAPNPSQQVNPFLAGQAAMAFDGVWWIADLTAITDFEWDIAMFPKHPQTGKRTTTLESDGWWVFKSSKNPDLAWSLASFLASKDGEAKFAAQNYVIPPSIPDAAKAWYDQTPPEHRSLALQNVTEDSRKIMMTYFDVNIIADAWGPVVERAFFNGEDITSIMSEAQTVADQELQRAWERFSA